LTLVDALTAGGVATAELGEAPTVSHTTEGKYALTFASSPNLTTCAVVVSPNVIGTQITAAGAGAAAHEIQVRTYEAGKLVDAAFSLSVTC